MPVRDLLFSASSQGGAPSDPYFENVSLLLSGDGTNGAQNNTFLDSSTNNFTITRNGNTTQGSFSPYGSLWSNYFKAGSTGDYLSIATNTALDFGSSDFTVECWINPISFSADAGSFMAVGPISGGASWSFTGASTGQLFFSTWISGTTVDFTISSTTNMAFNVWNHVAVTRNGSAYTMWLNGVSVGTATSANAIGNTGRTAYINYGFGGGSGRTQNCYISNVRWVKGTAVYTSAFTPSTTPLTAVSGTSLLTCQSNRFIDNSSNAFAITVNGTPSVQRFSPFNPTAPYSTSVIGGSGYFDGSGDYLNLNNVVAPGSGDFTIEFWVYNPNQSTTPGGGIDYRPLSTQGFYVTLGVGTDGAISFYTNSAQRISTTLKCQASAWNHVALVKSSGTTKIYVNGVADAATYADSNTYLTGANRPVINGSGYFATGVGDCYISDFRIVIGTAVYTTNFTPPTAPLTAITNTSLLTNFTNAGIPDLAMMNNLETVGNAQVSTSVKKYGTGSLAFDGTGDYLTSPSSVVNGIGSGDFTFECWAYHSGSANNQSLFDCRTTGTQLAPALLIQTSTNYPIYVLNGSIVITGTTAISTSTWTHLALCRSGTSTKIFVNGVQTGSTYTDSNTYVSSMPLNLGAYVPTPTNTTFVGYLDDVRFTKGYARYTTTFTPPASALPTY